MIVRRDDNHFDFAM